MRVRTTLLLLILQTAAAAVQLDSASIRGVVTKEGTVEPIAGAVVELSAADRNGTSTATTAANGTFSFAAIKPGSYRLVVTHPSNLFVPTEYLQRSPQSRGAVFPLSPGQVFEGVRLEMALASSISGRILDRAGQPVGYARVLALRATHTHGTRALTIVQTAQSNDRGEYRFFWLSPGDFYIAARSQSLERMTVPFTIMPPGYDATSQEALSPQIVRRALPDGNVIEETDSLSYYGGGSNSGNATPVTLRSGSSPNGIDVAVGERVRTYQIRGRVTASTTGAPFAGATVRAVPLVEGPQLTIPMGTTDARGNFELHGAIPGAYLLFAAANTTFLPLSADGLTGYTRIQVEGNDIDGAAIVVQRGIDFAGRIEIEGRNRERVDLSRIRVELRREPDILGMPAAAPSTGNNAPTANVSADGSFILRSISPGDYVLGIPSLPEGVYLKSMLWNGQSILGLPMRIDSQPEDPVIIALNSEAASSSVQALDERQLPVANATVVFVPDLSLRERRDRFVVAVTDLEGRVRVPTIAPGRYTVLAWDFIEDGRWEDAAFIRSIEPRGTTLQLNDNGKEATVVTVIRNSR